MVTLSGPIKKHCNCKNSRCLKLYCECFASGRYCDNCNCVNCCNNKESEQVRQAAVEAILERNPNAFRPKIQVRHPCTPPFFAFRNKDRPILCSLAKSKQSCLGASPDSVLSSRLPCTVAVHCSPPKYCWGSTRSLESFSN